jgi:hypothetical protein
MNHAKVFEEVILKVDYLPCSSCRAYGIPERKIIDTEPKWTHFTGSAQVRICQASSVLEERWQQVFGKD